MRDDHSLLTQCCAVGLRFYQTMKRQAHVLSTGACTLCSPVAVAAVAVACQICPPAESAHAARLLCAECEKGFLPSMPSNARCCMKRGPWSTHGHTRDNHTCAQTSHTHICTHITLLPTLTATHTRTRVQHTPRTSVYLPATNVAVFTTYNGYITATAYGGAARMSNLTISPPISAAGRTQGLGGSWDGNTTNDFVDSSGHDWMQTYPGNIDAAGYAFGQTWTVQPSQSFFVNVGPQQIGCNITENDVAVFSMGCLFGTTNATNLLNYSVDVPTVLQTFNPSSLPPHVPTAQHHSAVAGYLRLPGPRGDNGHQPAGAELFVGCLR